MPLGAGLASAEPLMVRLAKFVPLGAGFAKTVPLGPDSLCGASLRFYGEFQRGATFAILGSNNAKSAKKDSFIAISVPIRMRAGKASE